jgi:peptide-methionine (S)-S-oxide reductase
MDEQQKETALTTIAEIEASGLWPGPVVTEINPEEPFWQAEPEHQNYLQRHPRGYSCHFVRPNWRLPSAHTFRRPATAEGPKD